MTARRGNAKGAPRHINFQSDERQSRATSMNHAHAAAKRTAWSTFLQDWLLYLYEASELAIFMISACVCTVILFHSSYPAVRLIPSAICRRMIMGVGMGITAICIIHSPMGKRSGAHFNPAITFTYLRIGKIAVWDAMFYVLFQFAGGVLGVGASALVLGKRLADPNVEYAVTVPGQYGTSAAFAAEAFMAAVLMGAVLFISNRPRLAPYTSYVVGILIALYILFFAPVSGFSINPARTVGSAVFAHIWTACWVYFAAPLLGMLAAAELYLRSYGPDRILCPKLHPDPAYPCPFECHFPFHFHPNVRKT